MPSDQVDSDPEEPLDEQRGRAAHPRRKLWRIGGFGLLIAVLVISAYGWFSRDRIADDLISTELERLGIPATYKIESIGPAEQVLSNVVIGDPARPDLTIARVIVRTKARLGMPGISSVVLVKPRLFGTYRDGLLSFGALDRLIFTDSTEPFRLPDLSLTIVDGGGLLQSDHGAVGIMVEGSGSLRGGFTGTLAAVARELTLAECRTERATLYGKIGITAEKPSFAGPLRVSALSCPDRQLTLAQAAVGIEATADPGLDGGEGRLSLEAGKISASMGSLASAAGNLRFSYRGDALTMHYDLAGQSLTTPQARIAKIGSTGRVRSADGLKRIELEGTVDGDRLSIGQTLDGLLAQIVSAGEGTLAEPLGAQIRTSLLREMRGSSFTGNYLFRKTGKVLSIVVPQATIRGRSGEALLSVSRFQMRSGGAPDARIMGNFATGGRGLPRLSGRMERAPGGAAMMRLTMPEYRAGAARLALPRLIVAQVEGGSLGFAGQAVMSGAIPGGTAENLVVPIDGTWSAQRRLAMWRQCLDLRFDKLALVNLVIQRRSLTVCPARGAAIVRSGTDGTKVAGGIAALDVTGSLGRTPIRIASGPVGFAWPGVMAARELDITLGPRTAASQFTIARLEARLGKGLSGTFDDADVLLNAVPLDILDTAGSWRYADGALVLSDGQFRLEDREQVDRFQPLVARDASLRLKDNAITAEALLREPRSDREILRAQLLHDLATGRGNADLATDGIQFDDDLQPDTVSRLALGVIANAKGVVRGSGRIAWTEEAVTSSGSFTTDGLDFAAAFGPVKGVSGTVRFTDLLGLVTAPDQRLAIASINPGIEVNEGFATFEIRPGYVLAVKGAQWPFFDGTLTLLPSTMTIGSDETLRYTLKIDALNAARFVEHMELGNLSASGTFDGAIPLVFDQNGGRVEGGRLQSRAPGGNVAYVGELTYEDLSTMANFAFDALRSLDYQDMDITLDGALEGEILTRLKFRGVSQGEGASSNFLTKRVAKLPIQFNVNLRAPFFQLIASFKSLYDPEYVRDPRTLGLIDAQGGPGPVTTIRPTAEIPIQPSESDITP